MAEMTLVGFETIGAAFDHVVKENAEVEALVHRERHVTYRELGSGIDALAGGLRQLGIQRGEKVALMLPNSVEFVNAFVGTSKAGAAVVPMNPLYRRHEMELILNDSEASVALIQPRVFGNDVLGALTSLRDELPHLRQIVVLDDDVGTGDLTWDEMVAMGRDEEPANLAEGDDLFGLIYTSGTTGRPKGAMHTHRTMLAPMVMGEKVRDQMLKRPTLASMARMARTLLPHARRLIKWAGGQQTMLSPTPFHALAGYGPMLGAIVWGDRFVMIDRFHPAQILQLVEQHHVNMLFATPTMYAMMLDAVDFDRYDVTSLLYCGMGAAPCPPPLVKEVRKRFGAPVLITFGATEMAGSSLVTRADDPARAQVETVGRVMEGADVKIVDDNRREVPVGTVGELACKMGGVMTGYYKAPEATAKALDEDGWYYTGDYAMIDEKGYVSIVGRKKDMIIRGGQNIYPAEIEAFMLRDKRIQSVSIVGVPDKLGGESVWAFVVPNPEAALTGPDVLAMCRGEIAPYKVPSQVRILDELPLTPTGKVQKYRLRELAQQEIGEAEGEAPDLKFYEAGR